MKKILIFLIFQYFFVAFAFSYQFKVNLEIQDKNLKQFQPIARAELPFPKGGYIFVTDRNGLKLQSVCFSSDKKQSRRSVYFKTNESDVYYVYYLSEERKQDTSLVNEIQDGRVLIDDYLNPGARTSGFWFWTAKPCLSGKFSHTGRSMQKVNFHYTAIVPGEKTKPSDILYQYVFIERNQVPQEIMIEIQTQKRKSYYFSWGSDVIKWKGLSKIFMGQLPENGKWARLIIPIEKMGKNIEITGIGFYNAGGKVYWDYTTVGNPILNTKIIKWKKQKKKTAAFFDYEIFGPFMFAGNSFSVVNLDASASTGADAYLWLVEGKKYKGNQVIRQIEKKQSIYAELTCLNAKNKQSDTFSETIVLPEKTAEEVNLITKIMPHRNVINAGQSVFIPVQIISLMSGIIPVGVSTDNETHLVRLLPGKDNSVIINLFLKSSGNKSVHRIETKIGDTTIDLKGVVLSSIDDTETKILQGPYIKNEKGDNVIVFIPDYRFSVSKNNPERRKIVFIGDIPYDFVRIIEKKLPDENLKWLKYPETQDTYHALSNLFWIKKITENIDADTIVIFPSMLDLLRRTPIDEWTTCLDGIIYCLSKKSRNVICATPFPSAPIPEMFKFYADATVELCKKRNVVCLDLYSAYTGIPGWENFFSKNKGIYRNFPSENGIQIFVDTFLEILGSSSEIK